MNLNGIFTAITTPFDDEGAVAVDSLRAEEDLEVADEVAEDE